MAAITGIVVHPLPLRKFAPRASYCNAATKISISGINGYSEESQSQDKDYIARRALLVGVGLLSSTTSSRTSAFAQDVLENYKAFVDFSDGYSYYYPSEWRDFDFIGYDSAFKDRILPLQNVRVSFKPTDKSDVLELGPMEEVVTNLVRNVYSAPSQRTQIFDMQERSIDGKNYWTFEYEIASPGFSRAAFATIAVGNAVLGRLPGTTVYRNVQQYPKAYTYHGIVVVQVDAPIYFANISYIKERNMKLNDEGITRRGPEVEKLYFVIIEMAPVADIDSGVVEALKDLYHEYKLHDIQLA